jgi:hypothetical protein
VRSAAFSDRSAPCGWRTPPPLCSGGEDSGGVWFFVGGGDEEVFAVLAAEFGAGLGDGGFEVAGADGIGAAAGGGLVRVRGFALPVDVYEVHHFRGGQDGGREGLGCEAA